MRTVFVSRWISCPAPELARPAPQQFKKSCRPTFSDTASRKEKSGTTLFVFGC